MSAEYLVSIDWNGDADYGDTGEDVTSRVLAAETVTIAHGRDTARNLAPASPGTAGFVLNNRSRDYSPDNTSSPLYPNVGPGRRVRIEAYGPPADTNYRLHQGWVDGFELNPAFGYRSVGISTQDTLGAELSGRIVSGTLFKGIRTGEAIEWVLAAAGWGGTVDIDPGASVLPYWWLDQVDALEAIQELVRAEGPPAIVYVSPSGALTFRDRHHRLTRSASTTSQATFRDSGAEPKHSDPFVYDAGFADVVNAATFDVEQLAEFPVEEVYTIENVTVPVGPEVRFTVRTEEPVTGPFLSSTSYHGGSLSLTSFSQVSPFVFIRGYTATGSDVTIDLVKGFAAPIRSAGAVQVSASDSTSIARYGTRTWDDTEIPWVNQYDAEAVADLIVAQRKDRAPAVSLTVKSGGRGTSYDTRLTQQFARKISDRVTVVEGQTGLNRDGFIERVEHDIDWSAQTHTTRFYVDMAGTAAAGTLFQFDVAGHGFDDGVFAL